MGLHSFQFWGQGGRTRGVLLALWIKEATNIDKLNSLLKISLRVCIWPKSLYRSKSNFYFQVSSCRWQANMIKPSVKKLFFPDIPRNQANNSTAFSHVKFCLFGVPLSAELVPLHPREESEKDFLHLSNNLFSIQYLKQEIL